MTTNTTNSTPVTVGDGEPAVAQTNTAALERAISRWNDGDLDGYLELYDTGIRLHGYTPESLDRAAVRGFYTSILTSFPGCTLTLHETIAVGDTVTSRFTLSGRHAGDFLGVPATGTPIALPGITILRFRDGLCVERWSCADMLGVLVQIGAVAVPA